MVSCENWLCWHMNCCIFIMEAWSNSCSNRCLFSKTNSCFYYFNAVSLLFKIAEIVFHLLTKVFHLWNNLACTCKNIDTPKIKQSFSCLILYTCLGCISDTPVAFMIQYPEGGYPASWSSIPRYIGGVHLSVPDQWPLQTHISFT